MKRNKKKMKWWKKLILTVCIVLVAFLAISVGTIIYFTGDSLSGRGMLAMIGYSGLDLPKGIQKMVLEYDRDYSTLPELLVMEDGTKVTTKAQYEARREELLELYETYMIGHPAEGEYSLSYRTLSSEEVFGGKGTRSKIEVTVSTDRGSKSYEYLLFTPHVSGKFGVFAGLNFNGDDVPDGFPVEELLDRGYGLLTAQYTDFASDDGNFRDGILSLFDTEGKDCTSFIAWTLGLSVGIDYLYDAVPEFDRDWLISFGHSRLARVSLCTAALDERITVATQCCGGGMIRSEVSGRITASDPSETVWFTAKHSSYENRDYEIPVDTHFLNALIADRPLYISMGDSDLASDPYSTYDAFRFAGAVWKEIYGIEVLPEMDYFDIEPGKEYFSAGQGMHLHRGAHSMTWEDDWIHFVNYVDYLKKMN